MSLVCQRFELNETKAFDCWIFAIRRADGGPDEFWFKGNDVAEFMEYKKPGDAITNNVSSEWRRSWCDLQASGGNGHLTMVHSDDVMPPKWQPHTMFISEVGLYALVTRSKKPEAVKFTKWINEKVLPSLRCRETSTISTIQHESMDTSPPHDKLLLQKDLIIQKLNYENRLMEKEQEKEQILTQAREAQLIHEKKELELHYRYAFQNNSAKEMGEAAIKQFIQRKTAENTQQLIKTEIIDKYRLIRNMDDINPMKINHLGIVFDTRTNEYRIIRQQYGTTLRMYDCVQKTENSDLEQLEPNKHKRRLNTDCYVIGDLITVAHGVNIWTNYLNSHNPCLFGLLFSAQSWNKFSIMDEPTLREHYQHIQRKNQKQYSEKLYFYYKTLFGYCNFTDIDDCVVKCLSVNIWQLRQKLLDHTQTLSYNFIESASVSGQPAITFEELVNESVDDNTAAALNDVSLRFPEDIETLRLRTICERQQLIQPSSLLRNIQQFAIDSVETASVGKASTSQQYTVQLPNTPRRPPDDAETMSITSVETQPTHMTRYLNDLTSKRQTKVDKYTK